MEEIRPDDIVWIPPGEKHWHGGTATTAMTHLALHEKLEGKPWTGWSTSRTSSTAGPPEGSCRWMHPLLARYYQPAREPEDLLDSCGLSAGHIVNEAMGMLELQSA